VKNPKKGGAQKVVRVIPSKRGILIERKQLSLSLSSRSRKAGESYAEYYCPQLNYVVEFHVRWKRKRLFMHGWTKV
jgi:hypothetical protein